MADISVDSEQKVLESGRSDPNNGLSISCWKKKNRGKKRKTLCYVDFDQATGEEDLMQSAASLTWPGTSSSLHLESDDVRPCTRESVTYEDEGVTSTNMNAAGPVIVRGRWYNKQFNANHVAPPVWMHTGPQNFPVLSEECAVPNSHSAELFACVDPTVLASEKKAIFKKPNIQQGNTMGKKRKPLTASQKRRKLKCERYKDLQKKQEEKAKERAAASTSKRPCRFFMAGNCNKGKRCCFSHDCEVVKKPELCKFYLLSTCTKGLACPYYHGDFPCKFFHVFKFCMNGNACKFSHEPLTDESRQLLEKAMSNGATTAAGNTDHQLAGDVAKENCQSNGNVQQTMNYGAPVMPQYMMPSSQSPSNASVFNPHQHIGGCPVSSNTHAVSLTLQQKVYRLHLIEFQKPVTRELPPYIDVNDPRWSADPRVRPCVPHVVTAASESTRTERTGLNFYSSGESEGRCGRSDAESVVRQPSVSDGDLGLVMCAGEAANLSTNDCSSVSPDLENNISNDDHFATSVPVKLENPVDVVKAEPADVAATTASVARHLFQHNVSWLSVSRSSGVQKLSHAKNGST